jgi:hypothetical protein
MHEVLATPSLGCLTQAHSGYMTRKQQHGPDEAAGGKICDLFLNYVR